MAVAQPNVRVYMTGDYQSILNATQQAVVGVEGQIEQADWQHGTIVGCTPQRPQTWGVRLTATIWREGDPAQNNWRLDLTVAMVNPNEPPNPGALQDLVGRFIAGLQRWHGYGFQITRYG